MQQKIIQVGNKKLLVLDMPEGINKSKIEKGNLYYYNDRGQGSMVKHVYPNHRLLGFKTDLTESQWEEIVERKWFSIATVAESGLSLLQANDCNYNNALIIEIL